MSYLDLLTDDIMINILDARCDDIEKQISKLENNINGFYDDVCGNDIFDYDGNGLYLRFDNLVLNKKINEKDIFNPFHIGKAIIVHTFDTEISNVIINPNLFIYMNTAFKRIIKHKNTYYDDEEFYKVELPKVICVKDDITYFFQKIYEEEEYEDYEAQLAILRNDYAVADPYDEDEINQYYQD
jgi:hypothetical protein